MSFRKFKADYLFTGEALSSGDQVLITDKEGVIQEVVSETEAGGDIEELAGILSPGFINCHCHLELSHMKGLIGEKTGLVNFVFKVVTGRHFDAEEVYSAIDKHEQEMISNGIIAVGDICNNTLSLRQKQKHRLAYYNFVEVSGWLPALAGIRLERAIEHYNKFSASLLNTSIVPHAPYSVSEQLWEKITPLFNSKVVSIHNQETSFEDELFLQGSGDFTRMYTMMNIDNSFHKPSGKSSLQTYFYRLAPAASVILVHNTFTREEDAVFAIAVAQGNNQHLSFCLCPNANLYIENSLPPVTMLRSINCNITLGTDSIASNWSLSILDEIKTIASNFPSVTTEELLKWATVNGARALQMDEQLGTFEKGRKPGVILIDKTPDGHITSESSVRRLI